MNKSILAGIKSPADLKKLSKEEIAVLSSEVRKEIIEIVGQNGGHLSSNLGVVELTIALHRVFNSPDDIIIWDVGHQSYTHKLLTGRYEQFSTIRKKDGISGFPKRDESPHDFFDTGHSSTSISAAFGILEARRRQGKKSKVIAVIGDGALTGGMAFEALSHAGQGMNDLIVVLNDNKMSISPNTGALSEYLSRFTMGPNYQRFKFRVDRAIRAIPCIGDPLIEFIYRIKRGLKGVLFKDNFFVDLGFEYVGPLNGHNEKELEKVFRDVRALGHPVVVHALTQKGKGYSLAEDDPSAFHGVAPFCIRDGKVEKFDTISFTEAFSNALIAEADKNPEIVAITAAMSKGTGLSAFQRKYHSRFYDVGIAEQHAVTFAAGLAAGGIRPVVAIYSTFIQRAVDQLIHDVALQHLPVVFALDRAGPVPDDGETHQGLYDIALFRPVPGVSILSPASAAEMKQMLAWAVSQNGPVILRYPKTSCPPELPEFSLPLEAGRGIFTHQAGSDTLIVCTGGIYPEVHEAVNILARNGNPADCYLLRFIKPIDEAYFLEAVLPYKNIVFVEDGIETGGISCALSEITRRSCPEKQISVMAFDEIFYPQGTRAEILASAGLSPAHIADEVAALRYTMVMDSHS
ncbi:1-deoxy-D-xylulose-5-phosphate synthase [Brucepastera parasyntrophica]|uniref:1-deoxy-D-xylulose-5-phosphate synthase n=1 Tax=Brucepastera parasyntrophica TaxID=2880008 RepID=UPI00210EA3B0|nr:1-deoxy-D-xylulose-5-phosphate synthase [Brucepastera parasyntrophica]ULQ59708.1 1-deoxy-D-xylulose-5-phosphate synthase [Brucepastera parasyntrophica]